MQENDGQGKQGDESREGVLDYQAEADEVSAHPAEETEKPEERAVNLIVKGIAVESMAVVEDVRAVKEYDDSEESLELVSATLQKIYDLMLAAGVQVKYHLPLDPKDYDSLEEAKAAADSPIVIPTEVYKVGSDVTVSTELMAVACVALKKADICFEGEYVLLQDALVDILLGVLERNIELKVKGYETKKIVPLDLNEEMMFLGYLRKFLFNENVDAVLGRAMEVLHYQGKVDEVKEDPSKEGFGDYLGHLAARGKYQKLLDYRAEHPNTRLYGNAGEHIIEARIKKACFIDFDENGMPFSNDVTPQYEWADFRRYREQFFAERTVANQLAVMRRASVAELLRKLVNKDLDYGESQEADTTEVGLYSEELDQKYIRIITRGLNSAFANTREPLSDLFKPMEEMLREQMGAYEQVLKATYGNRFTILGPRIKTPESTMLKMLKEGKTTVASITDLIGFTVLTDTEAEAEQVYAEIRGTMDPGDIKEALTWETPTKRGYKSMDITGVPAGFQTRIQVQCRTKALDEKNSGQFSNHEAYKVFSGRDLLGKINQDPEQYLDQLYQIVHNLRCAFAVVQHESAKSPEVILDHYGSDYGGPMSLVRTRRLY